METVSKVVECPICAVKGDNKSKMELDTDKAFWRCPKCWTEVWVDSLRLKQIKQEQKSRDLEQQMRKALKHSIYPEPLPPVPIIDRNSRSSSKSGKRKKPIKKLKTYELI